jgi:tetratricopeptide (TPR) repeat protein/tRNA A-37 threonylcarbamoyl transferase component Bud32
MGPARGEHDLVFGILALQNGFIDQPALIAAFHAWTLDKSRAIADLLQERAALSASRRELLEALVAEHIHQHHYNPEQSLADLSSADGICESLARLGDPDINASMAQIRQRSLHYENPLSIPVSVALDETIIRTPTGEWSPAAGSRFRVLRPHARGGLGTVSVALDTELNREVALKQIQDQFADHPQSHARFVLEAEVTGGLEHPGIVPVYSLGHDGFGRPFYAMRFIRGDSLREAISAYHGTDRNPQDPGERLLALQKLLRQFLDVCNAIAYAHSRGVLHRDIKPANIMVGQYGETLVVDWGLAKVVGTDEQSAEATLRPRSASGSDTQPGSAIGTPAYMSPEQAAGELLQLGPASDVYSLGATLYTLLTGKAPFEKGDAGDILARVQRADYPPPREVQPAVPHALEAICLKAMARRPEDRYTDCRAMAQEIERWLADEPVVAYREPRAVRLRRWVRRNQRLVAGATAAACVGVIALVAIMLVISASNRRLAAANVLINAKNDEITRQNTELERKTLDLAAARGEAEKERDQAKEVTEFLVSSFRKPDPTLDGGKVTVAEVLGQAVKDLESREKMAAATRANIYAAVAETYFGLGLYQEMVPISEKAVQIYKTALGDDHPDTLAALARLGSFYSHAGKLERSIELLEHVIPTLRENLGDADPATLNAMDRLARTYGDTGQLTRAVRLEEQVFEKRLQLLGDNHPDTLSSTHNLATTYFHMRKFDKAIPMLEHVREQMPLAYRPDDPRGLTVTSVLALCYQNSGQVLKAIPLLEEVLAKRREKLTDNHPDTLSSVHNLALAYLEAGQGQRAIPLFEQNAKAVPAKLGADHPNALLVKSWLAEAYTKTGRNDRAIAVYEEILPTARAKLAPGHPTALRSRQGLADAYEQASRFKDAEFLLHELIDIVGRQNPRNDRTYALAMAQLGRCVARQRRFAEALSSLREATEISRRTEPGTWTTAVCEGWLGEALVAQHIFDEAETILLASRQTLLDQSAKIPPRNRAATLRDSTQRLVQLYAAWQKPAEAEKWRKQVAVATPSTDAPR